MATALKPNPDQKGPTTTISSATLPQLPLLGTTALASPVPGSPAALLACNPAIDLTAAAADGGAALHVWRAGGGQLVSKHAERGRRVVGLRWKENGMFTYFPFSRFCESLAGFSPFCFICFGESRKGRCCGAVDVDGVR